MIKFEMPNRRYYFFRGGGGGGAILCSKSWAPRIFNLYHAVTYLLWAMLIVVFHHLIVNLTGS